MHTIKLSNDRVKREKKSALRLLRKLNDELPEGGSCYISGGAPRDWDHGFGCRDIDIFYHVPNNFSWKPKSFKRLEIVGEHYKYHLHDYIVSVCEYKCTSGFLNYRNIQLIHCIKDPLEVIKHFPINMSRIWMGISGKISCDWSYSNGRESKLLLEMHREQYNYHYLSKIMGRFDNYAFIPFKWKDRTA